MNLDPNFLTVLLKACSEADFRNEEQIAVENSVLEFLESLLQKHPEPEVGAYYRNELRRLRGEQQDLASRHDVRPSQRQLAVQPLDGHFGRSAFGEDALDPLAKWLDRSPRLGAPGWMLADVCGVMAHLGDDGVVSLAPYARNDPPDRRAAALPLTPPMAGPVLNRLFQTALSVGGRVRAETSIGEGSASVASVTVTVPGWQGYRQGSAFAVRPTLFVTDFHVVAEADRLLTIPLADGTVLPWSRMRLISRPYDLALIETPAVPLVPLPIAAGARQGERVAALAGRWVRTSCGVQAAEAVILAALRRLPHQPWRHGVPPARRARQR